jgi:hypothetical protein
VEEQDRRTQRGNGRTRKAVILAGRTASSFVSGRTKRCSRVADGLRTQGKSVVATGLTLSFGLTDGDAHLTTWPATYTAENALRNATGLGELVVPQLLVADHPAITALRAQYTRCSITIVEMTGVGFFVNYAVPDDASVGVPRDFAGGNAEIQIAGLEYPAGCVLFVRDGKLSIFEVYIVDDAWPEDDTVLGVERVVPLLPPAENQSSGAGDRTKG